MNLNKNILCSMVTIFLASTPFQVSLANDACQNLPGKWAGSFFNGKSNSIEKAQAQVSFDGNYKMQMLLTDGDPRHDTVVTYPSLRCKDGKITSPSKEVGGKIEGNQLTFSDHSYDFLMTKVK